MSFKSVMKKIGKIALTAAPYVAAPFTGGASLMATGLANKAVQKWSESDAKKAIAKGLEPSSFDKVLGKVGMYSGLASSFIPTNALGSIGMLGSAAKAGSTAAKVGSTAAKAGTAVKAASTASKIGKAAANIGKGALGGGTGWQGQLGGMIGNVATDKILNRGGNQGPTTIAGGQAMPGGAMSVTDARGVTRPATTQYGDTAVPRNSPVGTGLGPSSRFNFAPQANTRVPDLTSALNIGRKTAIQDQKFRKGYDVTTTYGEPNEEGKYETRVTRMPKISPYVNQGNIGGKKKKNAATQSAEAY